MYEKIEQAQSVLTLDNNLVNSANENGETYTESSEMVT